MSDERRLLWFVRVFGPLTLAELQAFLNRLDLYQWSLPTVRCVIYEHWGADLVDRVANVWDVTAKGRRACPARAIDWRREREASASVPSPEGDGL
jgi:hypothetical protein